MTAAETRVYKLGEFHPFSAGSRRFLYLVPAGAIFELDAAAQSLIDRLASNRNRQPRRSRPLPRATAPRHPRK